MKKSSFFLFGMLAVLLAFGMVLAGCEGPAGPAGPAGSAGADGYPGVLKLAADSLGARGDEEITSLTNAAYVVSDGSKWYATKDDGTLSGAKTTPEAALADTDLDAVGANAKITGLNNRNTYNVYLAKVTARTGATPAIAGGDHSMILVTGTLVSGDALTFAANAANAGETRLYLNGAITNASLSATALGSQVITTNNTTLNTYTFTTSAQGNATIEYTKGNNYVVLKSVSSTTAFSAAVTNS